ncbi:glycosyltransferase family 2 protein [Bacterioplanoides sp. SCSIO 12839]|uniref:glycosyltransferase family 2 protein n=1 Tax=Bacterioplanoides sp. SCSIO 12839 TaxID=2829569 RepID=UPI002104F121|nr:glycosyltransferase family 2 protein [Bacterioplanoides sp. SCSIO 12839]UTW48990.1 glycosyltransferase family 2 protein [Bacterioplanoides sp. SCSIO 12839]
MLISVCMCTYKRLHVVETLKSIDQQQLPEGINLEVVVVDNDESAFARDLVLNQAKKMVVPVVYAQETAKNIAKARNKTIANASGEWLAFIDDDEVADAQWIKHLLATAEAYQADVVFGRVISLYPENTPQWVIKSGAFERPTRPDGSVVTSGGTNSTLVNKAFLDHNALKFDEAYGLTGGEDADLFHRMHELGAKLVTSNNATVSEEVAQDRLNSSYILKKCFRVGETYTRYRLLDQASSKKIRYMAENSLKGLVFLVWMLLLLPMGKNSYFKPLLGFVDKAGKLKALFSKRVVELY